MKFAVTAALLILMVLAGTGAGYFVAFPGQRASTSIPITTSSMVSTPNVTHSNVFVTNVNNSFYYADDISQDTVVQNPGYSYFLNGSVLFDGVKFEMICPRTFVGCPTKSNTTESVTIMAGAFEFSVKFVDGSNETIGTIIGDLTYVFALSQHTNPRAGILIEYIQYGYPNNFPAYRVFLLVSYPSCCG